MTNIDGLMMRGNLFKFDCKYLLYKINVLKA